jgi:protoporphyrinogen oxidase
MFVQTLHEGGLRARHGNIRSMDAVWPRVSLHDLFVAPAEQYLRERDSSIVSGSGVVDVDIRDDRARGVRLADGTHIEADAVVLALPPWALTAVLDNGALGLYDHFSAARKIEAAPISSVYVWLDRVFDTSGMHGRDDEHCYALAVSASWDVVHLKKDEFVAQALDSLRKHYPAFADAEVLRTHVIHQPQATFSAQPGFEDLRLPQRTPIEGLFLAGDWTETELPSTMEAAAESAVRAVAAVQGYLV